MASLRFKGLPALLCGALCLAATVHADALFTPAPGGGAAAATVQELPVATRVVVYKAARRMDLMHGEQVLRSIRVSLGLVPAGQKERAGDFRTPEGRYYLTRRNPRSDYFLSIQVSYPNDLDLRRAHANGWDPGGSIMIHGLPNRLRREPAYYSRDWTDGCIAVSDSDMLEIWMLTQYNTPIDILP
ncbi:MAG TPA: L,D-transpeptidase family protein [Steroidobacteraceae bacterium]|nr:L,D-transpeptidase family protein [Steroidobacteraceae bacterium]